MKYVREAYLRRTPPASPRQQGGVLPTDEMDQILRTIAVRQEEEATPYTSRLLQLKTEIKEIMENSALSTNEKVKLLAVKTREYRETLKKSRQSRSATAVTPPAPPPAAPPPPPPSTPGTAAPAPPSRSVPMRSAPPPYSSPRTPVSSRTGPTKGLAQRGLETKRFKETPTSELETSVDTLKRKMLQESRAQKEELEQMLQESRAQKEQLEKLNRRQLRSDTRRQQQEGRGQRGGNPLWGLKKTLVGLGKTWKRVRFVRK